MAAAAARAQRRAELWTVDCGLWIAGRSLVPLRQPRLLKLRQELAQVGPRLRRPIGSARAGSLACSVSIIATSQLGDVGVELADRPGRAPRRRA